MQTTEKPPVINNLQPNIQDLQGDVLDLLQNISKLMGRAKNDLSNNNSGDKYGEAQKEVEQAICNVKELELRMAIVAPMKAGKSTIINAIVGQDLLPSRNAAMTTIPTKISFNDSVEKPKLVLSENTLSIFKSTWESLQKKMNPLEESEIESRISQYPHLKKLAKEIKNDSFYIPGSVLGKDDISLVLTKLNDIVRLCCTLDPNNDPLDKLEDVPNIQTPFWRNDNTEQSEQLGNLVVVDTPGPNEAGENLRLTAVVEQELRRCSIILIVLDFTQLNNQAAEGVKQQVQPIIDLIGKDNLYVLVNKVDQRRSGDMNPDDVKKFVYSDLNLSETEDSERIFEISARQAFSATKFLLELQKNPDIEIPNMSSIEALAEEVLGNRWERKLQKKTKEDLQEEAEYLWEDSGFDRFIINSIEALRASAAPKCMSSAINRSHNLLSSLKDDLSLRAKAISQDAEKLELEINALTADLDHLESCRSRLNTVDRIKDNLHDTLDNIFTQLKQESQVSIQDYFKEEDLKQANERDKKNLFPKFLSKLLRKNRYKTKQSFEFDCEYDADRFVNQATSWARQRAENMLFKTRKNIGYKIKSSQTKLGQSLRKDTQDILEKARERLKKTFDVELSFPPQPEINNQLGSINVNVNSATREVTTYRTETYRSWHTLWIIKRERRVPITKNESYYTVSLQEIVSKFNSSIEENVRNIECEMMEYIDLDFKETIDDYFEKLDAYLSNYRNTLRQSQEDKKLDNKKKEQLVASLKYLIPEAKKQLEQTGDYQEKIVKFIKSL